ncbi:MAG: ABC transporter substrate-binding protein [Burkholderiales bacterium]|nr:ABC transporter substrate-binding protein [Burkholderiales bacterium]
MSRVATFLAAVTCCVVAHAQPIKVGGMCDRSGATKNLGTEMCPGVADYIALVNKRGGVLGHKIDYTEIDHAYVPPRAVEAYKKLKAEGAVTFFTYGVPTLQALTPYFMEDKIPPFNSGTGSSELVDGTVWPYIFPGTASYWSQAGVAMKYLKDNGAKRGTKVAYLYYDNPAGRDGIPMVDAIAEKEGFVVRKYAVQPPELDVERPVTAIVRDFKPDWVITSLFSRAPTASLREFKRMGYPLNRVVAFVYGAGDSDVADAGWDNAQGYVGLQFAAVGRTFPVIQDIMKMLRDEGKEVPAYVGGAYYNRGVLNGAIIVEGIRLAIQNHGMPLTGTKVKQGYEAIRKLDLGAFAPPLSITAEDHEGGGYLRIYQVKGREWALLSDWTRAYRPEALELRKKANTK